VAYRFRVRKKDGETPKGVHARRILSDSLHKPISRWFAPEQVRADQRKIAKKEENCFIRFVVLKKLLSCGDTTWALPPPRGHVGCSRGRKLRHEEQHFEK